LTFCSDSPPSLSHPTRNDHLQATGPGELNARPLISDRRPTNATRRVGQGRGSTTLICDSITNVTAGVIPPRPPAHQCDRKIFR
jgi:hypothetical protein